MRSFDSFNEAYCQLVLEATQRGKRYTPRNHVCFELRPGNFSLSSCRAGLYTGKSRRLNYRFLAIEALSYIAGWGTNPRHAEVMCAVNKQMEKFVNPATGLFDGAYGPRLRASLGAICRLLTEDPSSRQAYASIWSPGLPEPSLDIPCTLGLHFYQDTCPGGRKCLSMSAYMRSNDLNWGTPYDVAAFCCIQLAMSACLDWNPGAYHHTAGSLHVYEATLPKVNCFAAEEWLDPLTGPCLPYPDAPPGKTVSMGTIMTGADDYLHDFYEQVIIGGLPAGDFVGALENPTYKPTWFPRYWQQWGDLIRFSWKETQ